VICYVHARELPCEVCMHARFLYRVFGPSASRAPAVITFHPAVFEHMYDPWEKPRVIETPADLLRETHARGVESEYLRDSSLWRSRPPKEW
jgi:hypothetical protein